LQGEAGNDEIYGDEDFDILYGGEGDDTLEGGTGDDYLYGDKGNDVYKFNLGDGQDVIRQTNNTIEEFGSDKILFGEGINKENIILTREFDNLYIKIKDTSDSIKLEDYFKSNTDNYGYPVKQLEFADGTRLDITQGLTLEGNDYSELKGTRYDDTLKDLLIAS
jgi:Ca2+-binding RTX toxin-like protein